MAGGERRIAISVQAAIAFADSILPGTPTDESPDPRWQAVILVGNYIESHPEEVWEFVLRWGGNADEDLRSAIACCLLEHLLDYGFDSFFSRVESEVRSDELFARMFPMCWKFGEAKRTENSARFDLLEEWCGHRGE